MRWLARRKSGCGARDSSFLVTWQDAAHWQLLFSQPCVNDIPETCWFLWYLEEYCYQLLCFIQKSIFDQLVFLRNCLCCLLSVFNDKKPSKHKKKKQKKEKEEKEKKKKKKHHHHHHHSDGGGEESVQNGTVEEEEPLPVSVKQPHPSQKCVAHAWLHFSHWLSCLLASLCTVFLSWFHRLNPLTQTPSCLLCISSVEPAPAA